MSSVYMEVSAEQIAAIYSMADRPIQSETRDTDELLFPTGEDIAKIYTKLVMAIAAIEDDEKQFLLYATDRGLLVFRDVEQPGFYQLAIVVGAVHIDSAAEEGRKFMISEGELLQNIEEDDEDNLGDQ